MCGAVRYEAAGPPARIINCHCTDCRKHTGAPMATLPVYPADQVEFSGQERAIYESSPGTGRAFCPKCGTSLSFEANLRGYGQLIALHISTFDAPEELAPTHHSFYESRLPWFDTADGLPRHAGLVSEGRLIQHEPGLPDCPDGRGP